LICLKVKGLALDGSNGYKPFYLLGPPLFF
jgi:hypothetical protein